MKKLLILAGLILGMVFVSCSSDDDDVSSSSGNSGDIVGVWKYGGTDIFGNGGQETYMDFMSNGNIVVIDVEAENIYIGTWKRAGKKLRITLPKETSEDDYEEDGEYKIDDDILYITFEKTGVYITSDQSASVLTIVAKRVDADVISRYITIQKLDDFLKDKPIVNIADFQISLNDYQISLSNYQINPNEYKIQKMSSLCPNRNHPHAIDLGEAGKWACCNVGASSPVEVGGYYAWGQTKEKNYYEWETYMDYFGPGEIAGTKYDVAHVKWGGSWKMPSFDRFKSLINNCESKWVTLYEMNNEYYCSELGNNLFVIDGKYYIIDNPEHLYIINDKVYKIDSPENLYIIENKLYKINNTYNYFVSNGVIYDLSGVDTENCYIRDDYRFVSNKFEVFLSYDDDESIQCYLDELELNKLSSYSLNSYYSSLFSKGMLFTTNGNSIFLPAAGGRDGYNTSLIGRGGFYWSSTQYPYPQNDPSAYIFGFTNDYSPGLSPTSYESGNSVRPVTE